MADFGRLANEISIQHQQEQEKLTPHVGRRNSNKTNENNFQNNQNAQSPIQNFFIQTSSIKSNRSHALVSKKNIYFQSLFLYFITCFLNRN